MANQAKTFMTLGVLALVVIAAAMAAPMLGIGGVKAQAVDSTGQPIPAATSGGVGYATTVQTSVINAITKASITTARGSLYKSDNSAIAEDVSLSSATTSLTATAPNSLSGYAMIGNDANQGTDGGTEYYYTKVPVSYSNEGYVTVHGAGSSKVGIYAETASVTFTGYDDNTAESTTNITVGTSPVTTLKIKMEPAANSALGNPQLTNPLGVCVNVTTTATWNEISPRGVKYTSFATPQVYKGNNIVGCYQFTDTDAIADDKGIHNSEYTFGVYLDPASNPDQFIYFYPMDMTYFLDDNLVWQAGFADDSSKGTDYDPGLDGLANAKQVHTF